MRLCLNLIAPNNVDKKLRELRGMLIGDAAVMGEAGYNAEEMADFKIAEAKLDIVVQQIFRKAQTEHTYSNFYCKICEQIIRIELAAKNCKALTGLLKNSEFRARLLARCKTCFEEFF